MVGRRLVHGIAAGLAPTPASSVDVVMLIGASIRQEGQLASRELFFSFPRGYLPFRAR
jgi:hypothetical protein